MKSFTLALFSSAALSAHAQTEIPLYKTIPNSIPGVNEEKSVADDKGIVRTYKVSKPVITAYLPPKGKGNGKAVVICPGGGYGLLAVKHEGHDVAKALNEMGIAAFVLNYRLPDEHTMPNKSIGPVQDAQRAIQLVREKARSYGIKKDRVGIMGFSAGGHLASTAGTHFKQAFIPGAKGSNLRPDFMVLVYPVISFEDSLTHKQSRNNLVGPEITAEEIKEFSNDQQVTSETPPTFLVHAVDDKSVAVQNSRQFYAACKENRVPVEIFEYPNGGHGFGMNNPTSSVKWMDAMNAWLGRVFDGKPGIRGK
ncbi:alpha/beta hydrolase [Pseudoflavitalea sp. G-6-1-2]|uniref:alpha/beta hydrolase n=1 Tax=Pseudoflavitalea sp. G-6-1-2 TaxID=2728841 RepID=UPI001469FFFE|nr:alpha/beta hydrolase [Pseudoflavitalea sp. G-6-1-2]NML22819.1 alpha/beta hydrolase [Pseudoflavitalea sp. G-6-1-2]